MRQLKITKSITNRESASLDKYLQEIGREDLITVEEEVELAQRIRKGDRVALEKLTRANLRFVVSVAKQYQNQGLSLPDLINEGNLGLIKAAEKFDETRGFQFIGKFFGRRATFVFLLELGESLADFIQRAYLIQGKTNVARRPKNLPMNWKSLLTKSPIR